MMPNVAIHASMLSVMGSSLPIETIMCLTGELEFELRSTQVQNLTCVLQTLPELCLPRNSHEIDMRWAT